MKCREKEEREGNVTEDILMGLLLGAIGAIGYVLTQKLLGRLKD